MAICNDNLPSMNQYKAGSQAGISHKLNVGVYFYNREMMVLEEGFFILPYDFFAR